MSNNKNRTTQDNITDYCRVMIVPIQRKLSLSIFTSIISFIISATVLTLLFTESTLRVDYITALSFIVAVLTILVTIILANQIINYKEFKDTITGQFSQLSEAVEEKYSLLQQTANNNKNNIEQAHYVILLQSFVIVAQSIQVSIENSGIASYLIAFQALEAYIELTDEYKNIYSEAKDTAVSLIKETNKSTKIMFRSNDTSVLLRHIHVAQALEDKDLLDIVTNIYNNIIKE